MKKILILTELFRPEPGGMEGLLTGIARNWHKDSVYVCVISSKSSAIFNRNQSISFDMSENYTITRLDRPAKDLFFLKHKKNLEDLFMQILNEFSPDHILVGSVSPWFSALMESVKNKYPYSVMVNGGDLNKLRGVRGLYYKKFIENSKKIFTLTNYLKLSIKSKVPYVHFDKITVMSPAIDCDLKKKNGRYFSDQLAGRMKGKKIFLALGPLLPWKGIDAAIKAVGLLEETVKNKMHLLIVGSGPDYIFLNELIRLNHLESSITMTGFIGEEDLFSIMKSSHVFIQPHRNSSDGGQGLSLALMEACCLGLPSIIGRTGGVQELVEDERNGFLVESDNLTEIAEKMSELLKSDSLRKKMSGHASAKARREYNFKRLCEQISLNLFVSDAPEKK